MPPPKAALPEARAHPHPRLVRLTSCGSAARACASAAAAGSAAADHGPGTKPASGTDLFSLVRIVRPVESRTLPNHGTLASSLRGSLVTGNHVSHDSSGLSLFGSGRSGFRTGVAGLVWNPTWVTSISVLLDRLVTFTKTHGSPELRAAKCTLLPVESTDSRSQAN